MMQKYNICCIGHTTIDQNVIGKKSVELVGGVPWYCCNAWQQMEGRFLMITKCHDSLFPTLNRIDTEKYLIPAQNTHRFENRYHPDHGGLEQRITSLSTPFSVNDVDQYQADYYHLGPLSPNDMSLELIKQISRSGVVSLDAQGFLRNIVEDKVGLKDWSQKELFFPFINILKLNRQEATIITGNSEPKLASQYLFDQGIDEVIVTDGSRGTWLTYHSAVIHIPSYRPKKIVDTTGCGDTFMAGYLYQRFRGKDPENSAKFGSAMASLKAEIYGPFNGTEDMVNRRIGRLNQ